MLMKKTSVFSCFCLAVVICFSLITYSQAQENKAAGLAVVLVIDSSGSMKTNDPDRMSIEAAKKAVMLLEENDQLSVIEFNTQATVLLPLKKVGDESSRGEILQILDAINIRGDTDIKGALERAFLELEKAEDDKKKFVLFLSDGEPDLPHIRQPGLMAEYIRKTKVLAEEFKARDWAVHTIAFHEEEAAQLMDDLARLSGGEYFFVDQAEELATFFQSIMLAQKYELHETPSLYYVYDRGSYKEGQSIKVNACLRTGEDCLVPGPHLKLDKFDLVLNYGEDDLLVVPMLGQDKDGLFSASLQLPETGNMTLTIIADGSYRDQGISEEVMLGSFKVKADINYKEILISNWQIIAGVVGALILLVFAIFYFRALKDRAAANIKGILYYWSDEEDKNQMVELDLAKQSKKEIIFATDEKQADFSLPVQNRSFAFKIKKFYKNYAEIDDIKEFNVSDSEILYLAICFPGTYLIYEDLPKSRQQIFHGDRFAIGGYVFEFNCPEAIIGVHTEKDTLKILNRISKKKQ